MQETQVWSLGQEDPLEEGMATHSNILAWGILWTEEPGGLQFIGSQRVRHYWWLKWMESAHHSLNDTSGSLCLNCTNNVVCVHNCFPCQVWNLISPLLPQVPWVLSIPGRHFHTLSQLCCRNSGSHLWLQPGKALWKLVPVFPQTLQQHHFYKVVERDIQYYI